MIAPISITDNQPVTAGSVKCSAEEISRAAATLFGRGGVVELRCPNAAKLGTISGYYNDLYRLAEDASQADGKAPAVYWTLNPVKPDLLARASNRSKPYARETTADSDIVRRQWLLIDLDPKRISGVSSTDVEHEAAIDRGILIRQWLRDKGWPEPLFADSGNGTHLLYRIDLPNDDASRDLLRDCLGSLDLQFSDDVVAVDRTTFNAARICKVYGTVSRKGDSTPERPHRLSQILEASQQIETVSRDLLTALAAQIPKEETQSSGTAAASSGKPFDIEDWIARQGVRVEKGPLPFSGGEKWMTACPNNSDHKDAAVLRLKSGAIVFKCFHDSCSGYRWREFREHYEPGCYRSAAAGLISNSGEVDEDLPAEINYTDLGNARRLVQRYGSRIRHVHSSRNWLIWDGRRWRADATGRIYRFAKATLAAMSREQKQMQGEEAERYRKHILRSEAKDRIKAMVELAQSEPGIAILAEELDADGFLLNVLNGTLDLRTGVLRPYSPQDYITKLAPVNYHPDAKAPKFTRFLIQVLRGNRHLFRYVQRAVGYSLTGDCREQVLFICFGVGLNGKSTMLSAISDVLGPDYAVATPAETLAAQKRGGSIPSDVARLHRKRFVVVTELEGDLNESRLKRMTGEDTLTARFMFADFFDFRPEFKLWVACNERPRIGGAGFAVWRRVRLIPFLLVIDESQKDTQLGLKLRAEAAGILAWAVRGCLAWQSQGLGTPDAVTQATENFRIEADTVGRFVAERCEFSPDSREAARDLWIAYNLWCQSVDEKPEAQREFGRRLGGTPQLTRVRGGEGGQYQYVGLRLTAEARIQLNELNPSTTTFLKKENRQDPRKLVQTEPSSFSSRKLPGSEVTDRPANQKRWTV